MKILTVRSLNGWIEPTSTKDLYIFGHFSVGANRVPSSHLDMLIEVAAMHEYEVIVEANYPL
jgi:hypothetical protein